MSSSQSRLGGVVTIAAVAGLAAAIWTVVTYQPPKNELDAQRQVQDDMQRARAAEERVGGFRNVEARLRAMWSQGQMAEAMELAREWSRGNPESVVAGYWRITLLITVGDHERVRRVATGRLSNAIDATAERPHDPEAWYYRGWFERAMGLDEDAGASFDAAAELLRRQQPRRMPDATWHYNLACYEGLRGNTTVGLDELQLAIEAGWNDVAWMCVDPDLVSLRGEERFVELSVKMAGGKD